MINDELNSAIKLHKLGKLEEASKIYDNLLLMLPRIGYRRFVLLSLLCGVSLKVVSIYYKKQKYIASRSGVR